MAQIQSGQTYKIVNAKAGTVIDLSGGDNKSPGIVIGYGDHGSENQRWTFEQIGSEWAIRSASSGKYIGHEGQARDGARLIVVDEPVLWDIWPDEHNPSHYRFFVHGTRFNFDLENFGDPTPGTVVQLWDKTGGKHQTWIVAQ